MSVRSKSATKPAALKADIRALSSRIQDRRDSLGVDLGNLTTNLRNALTAPSTLLAAGFFGVALQRSRGLHGLRLLAILRTANAGLRLWTTAFPKSNAKSD